MRKNPHGIILESESKEQHLSTVSKSCLYIYIYILIDKVKKKFNQNFKLESNFAPCVLSNF